MKNKSWGILIFGIIEIIIGSIAFISVLISILFGKSEKPAEVVVFVLTTAAISTGIGIGILKLSLTSYNLLLFFAKMIILSKILVFLKVITLSGALETIIPASVKNAISILYHTTLIWYFSHPKIKDYFGERRNTLFPVDLLFLKRFLKKLSLRKLLPKNGISKR